MLFTTITTFTYTITDITAVTITAIATYINTDDKTTTAAAVVIAAADTTATVLSH